GAPARFSKRDNDRREVANAILLGLPPTEWNQIAGSLEFVRLKLHQVLHEAGEAIKSGYFLNEGMSSVLTVQPDGESVEVGLIGKEGFVGLPVIFGFKTSALRIITQGDGTAYRADVAILRNLLPHCPSLDRQLQRYSMILGIQSTQLAACNRLHDVEERLARWLLMSHDRIGGKTLPLTQEFLAQMLGTRRSTVSVAASLLQRAGMISYTRGNVTIVNKTKLEEAACDCYEIIQQQKNRWTAETP
ncbi:MAG: Crp/Fnr family transcriptional regulator, partial [Candidatus Sulfotelmatobacter sp.]